jgi:hypothetical protein
MLLDTGIRQQSRAVAPLRLAAPHKPGVHAGLSRSGATALHHDRRGELNSSNKKSRMKCGF